MLNFKRTLLALGLSALAVSCGVEEFATKKNKDGINTNPITNNTQTACSQFTYIKPKVDFLFLWDNSSSSVFINESTRRALNQTIDLISTRFDYHIMLAPLVLPAGSHVNSHAGLIISDTPSGEMSSQALAMRIDRSNAHNHLSSFPSIAQSAEHGAQRAIDILNSNKTAPLDTVQNAFRRNAHTIVVLMSTEDDDDAIDINNMTMQYVDAYATNRASQLNSIKISLNSNQLRFFSIVRKSVCNQYGVMSPFAYSVAYPKVSDKVFAAQSPPPSDINNNRDSFNLCSIADFSRIFDGINNSIQDAILKHKYDHWPVAQSDANIDPDEIEVRKDGINIPRLTEPVAPGSNGFSFTYNPSPGCTNTRYEPTPGEPFCGHVVKLYGSARIVYPECMSVRTQTVKEWYGYAHMSAKPIESSIQLKIDGIPVSKCGASTFGCNGWELIKGPSGPTYINNQNLRIMGPNNFTPKSPGVIRSGYFLKLWGNAAYTNGQSVEVIYDPSGT